MRRAIRLAFCITAAVGAPAAPALACSCRCQADAEAFVRNVPVFFRGRPVAESVAGNERRYTFDVTAVHKGEVPARVTLRTALHSAACGATFPIGEEVLVGAYPSSGGLSASLCTQFCIGQKRGEVERLLAR
jgi:hypothetical protein